ncbi:DUF6336 family protein [Streptomyces coeruleorubidus]|uniref:DUF6336 family protein n=1 Tax=Streptomyces coeruleorubidus TaxID=116188 RepID=A0ABZ0KPI3_STRC4|nr:DUF6336 family protein [Streptomyces coeruleorubidus]WOT39524.1 DUF6336 family protein [Streptomyces coeruleorubidus]
MGPSHCDRRRPSADRPRPGHRVGHRPTDQPLARPTQFPAWLLSAEARLTLPALLSALRGRPGRPLVTVFGWTCGGDIRRCRDWHTVTGQAGPLLVAAPVLLRVGVLALVLFPGAFGLHTLVNGAEYGSWLYGD